MRPREFYTAFLIAETAMIGLFTATNFFLFYVFWELMIVPMFLLIGTWGGDRRVYAAVKFLLFTLAGSLVMLVGMISLLHTSGTLDFRALAATKLSLGTRHGCLAPLRRRSQSRCRCSPCTRGCQMPTPKRPPRAV